MKVYLVCPVRSTTPATEKMVDDYVDYLENKEGYQVYYPSRDTDPRQSELDICSTHMDAIRNANEVHVVYDRKSIGSHFDMGMAFVLGKPIRLVSVIDVGKYSMHEMIEEWQQTIPETIVR